ncbi:hypothetical protein BH09BAC3_BH09BAC3_35630 [soil metagenome]
MKNTNSGGGWDRFSGHRLGIGTFSLFESAGAVGIEDNAPTPLLVFFTNKNLNVYQIDKIDKLLVKNTNSGGAAEIQWTSSGDWEVFIV